MQKITPTMTTLLLVRHGETFDNANQIMQGQSQGELNEKGIEQARETRDKLRHEPIDVLMSSDLKRAIDTCRIIAEPHGKPVVETPLLRERDWGSFTGRFIPDLKGLEWPDDIETTEQMYGRGKQFLAWIRSHYDGQTLLVVGHGIINRVLLSIVSGKPMNEIEKMQNAEVRMLDV